MSHENRVPSLVMLALCLACAKTLPAADSPEIELGISEYAHTHQDHPQSPNKQRVSTTDHAKLEELQGPFSSGPEVTRACLACHTEAGQQFMQSTHWTWSYEHAETGQRLGKSVLVNNYCTNARGNEGMCAQCHAGFNMTGPDFDFGNEENIDCLVCHESTGNYYKTPTTEGNEACSIMFEDKEPIDWTASAQSVKMPGRSNCGSCHFYGGGGDNVKHGDLSSALFSPPREVDVHMSEDGAGLTCINCHVGEGHHWAGSRYEMAVADSGAVPEPGMPRDTAACTGCHGTGPHPTDSVAGLKLNSHTLHLACETCHIPAIARGGVATMVDWDWRTMGKLKDGEGYKVKEYTQGDGQHRATYKSIKGDFTYDENFEPYYAWFDGTMNYTTIDTVFDPAAGPVEINGFRGSFDDPDSRIYPFKRMHTTMTYDAGNNTLVYMQLWGDGPDVLWGNYNFDRAIRAGMANNGVPYSGEWGFVSTYSYWPINHMVAPKEDALACDECHAGDGRLVHLAGIYTPGTGSNRLLDLLGLLAVAGTLGGVLLHAMIRIAMAAGRRKR